MQGIFRRNRMGYYEYEISYDPVSEHSLMVGECQKLDAIIDVHIKKAIVFKEQMKEVKKANRKKVRDELAKNPNL